MRDKIVFDENYWVIREVREEKGFLWIGTEVGESLVEAGILSGLKLGRI